MSQQRKDLLFSVSNKHSVSSGVPLFIDGDVKGRYCGYFQNEHGEQAVFVYHYATNTGTVWLGDAGWDQPYKVIDGNVADLTLNEPEEMWIKACWQAATANKQF